MDWLKPLCFRQLDILIQRGQYVKECKAEWYRRMSLEYPYIYSAGGIKNYHRI